MILNLSFIYKKNEKVDIIGIRFTIGYENKTRVIFATKNITSAHAETTNVDPVDNDLHQKEYV